MHLATFSAMLAAASVSSMVDGTVAEERALNFYDVAYRYSYERLLVLVSVFYDSYRGKDDYFYRGQAMTRAEQQRLHIHEAFLSIIAGVEDLSDATTVDAYQSSRRACTAGTPARRRPRASTASRGNGRSCPTPRRTPSRGCTWRWSPACGCATPSADGPGDNGQTRRRQWPTPTVSRRNFRNQPMTIPIR
ncbi:hypothetical protein [Streptomyces iranensis]|uniref:hypothetical protein n=1 Tax=Streptomyces iranensis TaxID=576784 RepID=UPI0039B76D76